MKDYQNIFRQKISLIFFIIISSFAYKTVYAQDSSEDNTLKSHSILPESLHQQANNINTPNLLVIFDSSGSMQWPLGAERCANPNDTYVFTANATNSSAAVCASNSNSRSFLARDGMNLVLESLSGRVNMGLMQYSYSTSEAAIRNNTGVMLESVAALTGAPAMPGLSATGQYKKLATRFLKESVANHTSGAIRSDALTPIEGSLLVAYDYYNNDAANVPNQDISQQLINDGGLQDPPTALFPTCPIINAVVLVTDGLASSASNRANPPRLGTDCTKDDFVGNDFSECTEDAARALFLGPDGQHTPSLDANNPPADNADSVPVYVVGFSGDNSNLKDGLDDIAAAGGTGTAALANDPQELLKAFADILAKFQKSGGSGSGVTFSSQSASLGAVTQARFTPTITSTQDNIETSVNWTGTLNSYFLDDFGYLREDTNGNNQLDGDPDTGTDKPFRIEFNTSNDTLEAVYVDVRLGDPTNDIAFRENEIERKPIDEVESVWEASKWLGSIPPSSILTHRNYTSVAKERHILTWTGGTSNSLRRFNWSGDDSSSVNSNSLSLANAGHLGTFNNNNTTFNDESARIVRFIRGQTDIPGTRNRTINGERKLLGDIINSSALQVDEMIGNYDLLPGSSADLTYSAFRKKYAEGKRRRMVYAGGNDGMLHAFNSGFFVNGGINGNHRFDLDGPTNSATPYELGSEIWAYVPRNLLPTIGFLADPTYDRSVHIAYMDGPIQAFDAKIFTPDADHPNGWGTIIVAGMRLGGKQRQVTLDSNGNTFTGVSSFVVMDVTNPEVPPKLIAEINDPNLRFTTAQPTVQRIRNGNTDDWFLVMGSGPLDSTNVITATGSGVATPRIFKYNLKTNAIKSINTKLGNGFIGDLVAQDWDNDGTHEAVYFGSIQGLKIDTNPNGGVSKIITNPSNGNDTFVRIANLGKPVVDRPAFTTRRNNITDEDQPVIGVGTGRDFTIRDFRATDRNAFHLIQDIEAGDTLIKLQDLVNVTPLSLNKTGEVPLDQDTTETIDDLIIQTSDGSIRGGNLKTSDNEEVNTTDLLKKLIDSKKGWYFNLPTTPDNSPSQKATATALISKLDNFDGVTQNLAFIPYYAPPDLTNLCIGVEYGQAFLRFVDINTGIAPLNSPLSTFRNGESANFSDPLGRNGTVGNQIQTGVSAIVNLDGIKTRSRADKNKTEKTVDTIKASGADGSVAELTWPTATHTGVRKSWKEIPLN